MYTYIYIYTLHVKYIYIYIRIYNRILLQYFIHARSKLRRPSKPSRVQSRKKSIGVSTKATPLCPSNPVEECFPIIQPVWILLWLITGKCYGHHHLHSRRRFTMLSPKKELCSMQFQDMAGSTKRRQKPGPGHWKSLKDGLSWWTNSIPLIPHDVLPVMGSK